MAIILDKNSMYKKSFLYKKSLLIIIFLIFLCTNIVSYPTNVFSEESRGQKTKVKLPPPGTVIIWENGNYLDAIRNVTGSNLTHAAIVLYEKEVPLVYEASRPNVHRYSFKDYVKIIKDTKKRLPQFSVHFLEPSTQYTKEQLVSMKRYADSQLGRPFGVSSYLRGVPMQTIHCSEYVGHILASSGRVKTIGERETPKTICDKAKKL
ncbi:MAG: hypothetical protein WCX46_04545 [Candidatus Paceibacterota bacterium]|jgi:hypothetical protein